MDAQTKRTELEMEELLCKCLWSQLQVLGLFREKQVALAHLREQAGISTNYDRWLQESIVYLERRHYLHCQGTSVANRDGTCTVLDPTLMESMALWQEWDKQKGHWMQNTNLRAQVVLLDTTLHALPAILTGQRPATEILFPNGSMQLVEEITRHNAIANYFNEVLAQLLVTYVQDRLTLDSNALIRILEISASTGGTTSPVLQMLQPYQTSIAEYCYSDISDAFLQHGKRMYATEYPYLTYQLLDVEKPLAAQGIKPGSYDVVIAANALHATSNIRRTVRNTKAALKKHGLLLLNEITGTSLFVHLTLGLLPGWWAYEDPELRIPGCPALSVESWEAVLSGEGFREISIPTQEAQVADQQVIIAESDGIVRRPTAKPPVEVGGGAKRGGGLASTPFTNHDTFPSHQPNAKPPVGVGGGIETADEKLHEKSIAYLKKLVGKVLNIPSTEIDATKSLIDYGLDSILMLQLTNALRASRMEISSTLFFEYDRIDALVEHFLHTQKEALKHLVGLSVPVQHPMADRRNEDNQTPLASPTSPALPIRPTRTEVPKLAPMQAGTNGAAIEREIAIIGLAGRYPGAKNVQAFWHLLKTGKSAIREIPLERWDWRSYFQAEKVAANGQAQGTQAMTMYTKWGGFLEDMQCFDASFFHMSPRETERIDPQERLFLEVSYACIEDAGYTPAGLQAEGPVAVFVGAMNGDYYPSGAAYWSIANRVSSKLGLRGPSVAIDTACSSSLTALHFAVESLMSGTSASAIVGGVNLIIDPVHYVRLSQLKVVSTGNQCKSFGENADGFVDGEGVGAILLKPKLQAEADGDHIYGVIKATAINHGGHTNGYTIPNPQAQAEVIEQALRKGRIDPRTISYIEAHGSGTELGDPIEITGLTRAFAACETSQQGTPDNATSGSAQGTIPTAPGWCAIGSVKSNIGHAEGAAGIAGVTKVLLQMRYGQLVPSLHAKSCNPHINFSTTPFVVQQELSEWKRPQIVERGEWKELPRRAGISSFGVGGSNAHVILEEYVERPPANDGRKAEPARPVLIVLSARTEEQLKEQVRQLLAWIQSEGTSFHHAEASVGQTPDRDQALFLHDLAYTLQVGREAMEERLALQVNSLADLAEKLDRYLQGQQETGDWYRGQVKEYKDAVALLSADEDLQELISKWFRRGKYAKLLQWWVKGLKVSWQTLYLRGEGPVPYLPRRLSLPTYPFARERYWLSANGPLSVTDKTNGHGKASNKPESDACTALQPLADKSVSSALKAYPTQSDQSQPAVTPSSPSQSVSQSRTNNEVGTDIQATSSFGSCTPDGQVQETILPIQELEEELARSLAQALYAEESDIDLEKPFIEMGLDSITSMEWIDSINKQYGSHLKETCVYDYPTIRQLADVLRKEVLKRKGGTQKPSIQSTPTLSLDEMLQRVQQGSLDLDDAEKVLSQL